MRVTAAIAGSRLRFSPVGGCRPRRRAGVAPVLRKRPRAEDLAAVDRRRQPAERRMGGGPHPGLRPPFLHAAPFAGGPALRAWPGGGCRALVDDHAATSRHGRCLFCSTKRGRGAGQKDPCGPRHHTKRTKPREVPPAEPAFHAGTGGPAEDPGRGSRTVAGAEQTRAGTFAGLCRSRSMGRSFIPSSTGGAVPDGSDGSGLRGAAAPGSR